MTTTKQKGDEFEDEVEHLLRLKGYVVERNALISGTQIDLVARKSDLLTNVVLLVECTDRAEPVGVDLVKEKSAILLSGPDSKAIYRLLVVTRKGFTAEARAFSGSQPHLLLLTLAELEAQLIDFTPYVDWYLSNYERSTGPFREGRLFDHYVELSGRADTGSFIPSVSQAVDDWLKDRTNNLLFILGEFGSGKTSFLRHLAYRLLRQRLSTGQCPPVPILFNLRDYRASTTLPQLITDTLVNRYGVEFKSFLTFERMCSAGRVLVLLDGFDEMTDRADRKSVLDAFNQIYLLAALDAKIILTCRSNFFRSNSDIIELLKHFSIAIPSEDRSRPLQISFEHHGAVVTIEKLGPEQIRGFIQKRFAEKADELLLKIQSVHDLSDLSTRPVLLDMILTTLPVLEAGRKRVNSAALYEDYTDKWTRRDDWRVSMPLNARQAFCDSLAWAMHIAQIQEIDASVLERLMAKALSDVAQSADQLQAFKNDLQTCAFLVRVGEGSTFQFAHQSFLEFFVARNIIDALAGRRKLDRDDSVQRGLRIAEGIEGQPKRFVLGTQEDPFETVRLYLADAVMSREGYFRLLTPEFIAREASRIPLASWFRAFDRNRVCFRDLGFEVSETTYNLSEEIATFAIEYLHNSQLSLGEFIGILPDDTARVLLADLLRLSRSFDLVRDNASFVREHVIRSEHEGLKASLAAALARGNYPLDEAFLRLLREHLSDKAWMYLLFALASSENVKSLQVCMSWPSLRAVERLICVLGLQRNNVREGYRDSPSHLASEITRTGSGMEQSLTLNACLLLSIDLQVTTAIVCALVGSGKEEIRTEATMVLNGLQGTDAWRSLRARATHETDPQARKRLRLAEQELRNVTSAEKNRVSWMQAQRDRAVRDRIWKMVQ